VGGDSKRLTELLTADLHGVRGAVTELIEGGACVLVDLTPTGGEKHRFNFDKTLLKVEEKTTTWEALRLHPIQSALTNKQTAACAMLLIFPS